jgi:dGTPase
VQLVDAADSIAYDAHDMDDALQMGLLSIEELAELSVVRLALDQIRQRRGLLPNQQLRQSLVHELLDMQVSDLLRVSIDRLRGVEGQTSDELCDAGLRLSHSDSLARQRAELESFLFEAVYRHQRLMSVRKAASARLETLFERLVRDPERLPLRFRQRAKQLPLKTVVGEYIAGMTDSFCDVQYQRATETSIGPLADW